MNKLNTFWNRTTRAGRQLAHRLHPRRNRRTLTGLLVALLLVGQVNYTFAQSGIPIIDQILDLIDQYKLGVAMMGIAVIALGFLAKPIAPEWSGGNRSAIASMVIGGILLVLLPTLAAAIVGS